MATIRAIYPQPLHLPNSRWEKLFISHELNVRITPNHLSTILHETGTGNGGWHEFFIDLMGTDYLLLYDLTSVFSWIGRCTFKINSNDGKMYGGTR